jgi:mannose-6-phosphate isomerase-like protein (cupin superfamily)
MRLNRAYCAVAADREEPDRPLPNPEAMETTDAAWARRLEIEGPEREVALAEAARIIGEWGLAMPVVEPLALDFGLGDFAAIGEIEYWIANDLTFRYCGKFLFLFDGQRCPAHRHTAKHETFFLVHGTVEMTIEGVARRMGPGDTLAMAPGACHTFRAVGGPALILEVSLPSEPGDNVFDDRRIGLDGVL